MWKDIQRPASAENYYFYFILFLFWPGVYLKLQKTHRLYFQLQYTYFLVRLWVELFVSKAWYKQKLQSVKKHQLEKKQQKWQQNKNKNSIIICMVSLLCNCIAIIYNYLFRFFELFSMIFLVKPGIETCNILHSSALT